MAARIGIGWFFGTCWVVSGVALGTDYFVNPVTGNDAYDGQCAVWDGQSCGPKLTIAAAMAVAGDGDAVILAPGTYTGDGNRDLDFAGKAMTVRSTNPDDPAVVAATLLDLQAGASDRHRAFNFVSGEGHDSMLAGLTIINGVGPTHTYTLEPGMSFPAGGGVLCLNSAPTIAKCEISDCTATYGAAVYCELGSGLRLVDCKMRRNRVCTAECSLSPSLSFIPGGAGLDAESASVILERCEISDCSAPASTVLGVGVVGFSSQLTLIDCHLLRNRAAAAGGASSKRGGAMMVYFGSAKLAGCRFTDNGFENATFNNGGGLYANAESLTVDGCAFRGNVAADGAAIYVLNAVGAVTIRDSQFSENTSTSGHVLRLRASGADGRCEVAGCTIAENVYPSFRAAIATFSANPALVRDSVLWNDGVQIPPTDTANVEYCDVRGGFAGTGNIDADPLFVDAANGDYHLTPGSPCINAGDPAATGAGEADIDGHARVWGGRIDMGADETASFAFGDLNCDGTMNTFDIQAFITAVSDPAAYAQTYPACDRVLADANLDGSVNLFDIQAFVGQLP